MPTFKHRHGEINPVFLHEERMMIAEVDKAAQAQNAQIIGSNGEKPILEFLHRYLPTAFGVVSGKFVTPSGELSPQIDIMSFDGRYPLLSHHSDGTAVVMLHSLLQTIEIKRTLGEREVNSILKNSQIINNLAIEIFPEHAWGGVVLSAIAYRTRLAPSTLLRHYERENSYSSVDITVLRVSRSQEPKDTEEQGICLHNEPVDEREATAKGWPREWVAETGPTIAPLSDFYYHLVQKSYYDLDTRGFSFGDIGRHMMEYMTWGTKSDV